MYRLVGYQFTFFYILLLMLALFTNSYAFIAITLVVMIILSILYKMGKGIVMLESISLFYVFTCLVMPVLGYKYYTSQHYMARLFKRYMQVPEDNYFSYALPAVIIFTIILSLPLYSRKVEDSDEFLYRHIDSIKQYLNKHPTIGAAIMITGATELLLSSFIPVSIKFFLDLIFFSSFAGLLMVYFGNNYRYKTTLVPVFIALVFFKALESTMFTVIAYMSVAMASFFVIGNNTGIFKKIGYFLIGCFMILVLQNTKMAYRKALRVSGISGTAQISTFVDIVKKQFFVSETFFQVDEFYPLFVRFNQGYNVSLVMNRVPVVQDFDEGDMVFKSMLASITPRFLWPDKPKAGGHFNMKYYAGLTITNYSTNVGPLGELYGAFGILGGVSAMALLALYIRFVYFKVWRISMKYPIMILWLPVIFYQATYSAENDVLQIFNSTVKTTVFLWLLSKLRPTWFGIEPKAT